MIHKFEIYNIESEFSFNKMQVIKAIPFFVMACIFIVEAFMMFGHSHVFDMANVAVPFSSGHMANGDASIFANDGFHFRNE